MQDYLQGEHHWTMACCVLVCIRTCIRLAAGGLGKRLHLQKGSNEGVMALREGNVYMNTHTHTHTSGGSRGSSLG